MSDQGTPTPPLRVEHGDPTPEELAVVVAVLAAAGHGGEEPAPRRSTWSGRARRGWRGSALPG